jgi:hypothetical protein
MLFRDQDSRIEVQVLDSVIIIISLEPLDPLNPVFYSIPSLILSLIIYAWPRICSIIRRNFIMYNLQAFDRSPSIVLSSKYIF